jgi:hypothetical protein
MGNSEAHPHYVDISIPVKIQELIAEMKNSSASKVSHGCAPTNEHLLTSVTGQIWDIILSQYGTTEITQKQVYAHWQHINEDC